MIGTMKREVMVALTAFALGVATRSVTATSVLLVAVMVGMVAHSMVAVNRIANESPAVRLLASRHGFAYDDLASLDPAMARALLRSDPEQAGLVLDLFVLGDPEFETLAPRLRRSGLSVVGA